MAVMNTIFDASSDVNALLTFVSRFIPVTRSGDVPGPVAGMPPAERGAVRDGESLSIKLCNSNNPDNQLVKVGNHRKRRYLLETELYGAIKKYGIERLVFLTVTTVDNCVDGKEYERRINSALTGFLRNVFGGCYVRINERQNRGAWHSHIVGVADGDVRAGTTYRVDHKGKHISRPGAVLKKYYYVCARLRERYQFGRCSVEPLGRDGDDVDRSVRYLSKYLSKSCVERGKRLVTYGRGWVRMTSGRCSMLTINSARWRWCCGRLSVLASSFFSGNTTVGGDVWNFICNYFREGLSRGEGFADFVRLVGERTSFAVRDCGLRDVTVSDYYVAPPAMVLVDGAWCEVLHSDGRPARRNPLNNSPPLRPLSSDSPPG